jgi:cytoskeleton protein RodZ
LSILKAIEGDSLTNLSPVYLKGFLKIYSKFLGVDPKDYVDDYREPSYKVSERIARKQVQVEIDKPFFKIPSIKLPPIRLNKKIITVCVYLAIGFIIWMILFNLGKFIASKRKISAKNNIHSPIQSQQKNNKKTIIPQKIQSQAGVLTTKVAAASSPKEIISGISLGIRTHENCWVSLRVDGKLVFQRVLEKGRFESWQAKSKIELSLGNAGVVELEINGQVFSNLGRKGKPLKNILITKEGLKIGR